MDQAGTVPPMSPSQPPSQHAFVATPLTSPVVGVGDWVLTILVASIPIVNIIVLLIWAFGSGTNPSKANWAKAMLIWVIVGIAIGVLAFIIIGTALFHAMNAD